MHCTIHNLWGSSVEAILYPHWSSVDVQSFISFLLLLNHCAIVLCTSCAGCTGVTGVADAASWTVLERERISSIHTWVGVKLFNLCRVLQFQLLLLLCSEVLKAGCFLKHLQKDKTKNHYYRICWLKELCSMRNGATVGNFKPSLVATHSRVFLDQPWWHQVFGPGNIPAFTFSRENRNYEEF